MSETDVEQGTPKETTDPDHGDAAAATGLPEDWVGHPLRKDEAIGRIPVQFKGTADAR